MKLSNLMNFSIQKKYYTESVASKLPISTRANHPASQANAASIPYGIATRNGITNQLKMKKKMKQRKNLGIWMDHTNAHLIEYTSEGVQNQKLNNDLSHQDMQAHLQQAKHTAHNKEQQQQANFYNKMADVMEQYHHVLLFGPTDAKKN